MSSATDMLAIVTKSSRLPELPIKNGQLIFIKDKQRIALDFGDTRIFYNQIDLIDTESDRLALDPVNGQFYFVIDSAILYQYQDGWVAKTSKPDDVLFVGTTLPDVGSNNTLYADTSNKEISVWNEEESQYIIVANKSEAITDEYIENLFKSVL